MRTDSRFKKYVLSAALVLALLATAAVWAGGGDDSDAAALTVSKGNDSGPGSLREVIAGANDGDIITFAAGVTRVTLTSGEISFDKRNITIDGKGVVTITKDATSEFRLLNSTATLSTLTLKGLTISNGLSTTGAGGGVYVRSNIVLEDCVFKNNTTGHDGGGLCADGDAIVKNCKFTGNTAGHRGGGVCTFKAFEPITTTILANCIFTGNTAGVIGGGAVAGIATLTNCTFAGNTANNAGALFFPDDTISAMTNCTISSNTTYSPFSGAIHLTGRYAYLFHCTVTNNAGLGVCVDNEFTVARLYNSIVAGNTASQIDGDGITDLSYGNLVEGKKIPGSSPAAVVTYAQVFGSNTFDPAKGTHMVLSDGIAADTATKITAADLATSELFYDQLTAVLSAIANDQTGAPRPSGKVTYGAVEVPPYVPDETSDGGGTPWLLIGIAAAAIIIGLIAAVAILQKKGKLNKNI